MHRWHHALHKYILGDYSKKTKGTLENTIDTNRA